MDALNKALKLLKDDNLVWSSDFETIRPHLLDLLDAIGKTGSHQFDEVLDALAESLTGEDPSDLVTVSELEAELGIYRELTRGMAMRDALRRLFGAI